MLKKDQKMLLKNSNFRSLIFGFSSCDFKYFEQKDSKKCDFFPDVPGMWSKQFF
jgi:hypothetical protein